MRKSHDSGRYFHKTTTNTSFFIENGQNTMYLFSSMQHILPNSYPIHSRKNIDEYAIRRQNACLPLTELYTIMRTTTFAVPWTP